VLNLKLQISKTTIRMREGFKAHEVINDGINGGINGGVDRQSQIVNHVDLMQ